MQAGASGNLLEESGYAGVAEAFGLGEVEDVSFAADPARADEAANAGASRFRLREVALVHNDEVGLLEQRFLLQLHVAAVLRRHAEDGGVDG